LAVSSGAPWSRSVFSAVSLVCTRDAEGAEDCRSGLFIAEELDAVADEGSGDTITINVETLFEAFRRTSRLGTIFLNCQNSRISGVSASRLKEFYCICHIRK
jgi:hypothetical protein